MMRYVTVRYDTRVPTQHEVSCSHRLKDQRSSIKGLSEGHCPAVVNASIIMVSSIVDLRSG